MPDAQRGRPRDAGIDQRVLEVTRHHLASHGYEAMSLAAVADEAGTTRQSLYRRWPTKADLATHAIGQLSIAGALPSTGDAFADLVSELESFRTGISRPDGLSMVGSTLLGSADPELVRLFRSRVVHPRRARIRAILQRAIEDGELPRDADMEVGMSLFTGSWYALALAGSRPPKDWARRTATLGWRALGGTP